MDNETREMFEKILDRLDRFDERADRQDGRLDRIEGRFDKLESRFDGLEKRFDSLENEVKEFRGEMKDQIKGLDGKMDLIYHKLKSDIDNQNPTPKQKYNVVKEDQS